MFSPEPRYYYEYLPPCLHTLDNNKTWDRCSDSSFGLASSRLV